MPKVLIGDLKTVTCTPEELNQTIYDCILIYGDDYSIDVKDDDGTVWCPV